MDAYEQVGGRGHTFKTNRKFSKPYGCSCFGRILLWLAVLSASIAINRPATAAVSLVEADWTVEGDPPIIGAAFEEMTDGGQFLADKIASSKGSYDATATQGYCCLWIMQLAAFQAAGTDITAPTVPINFVASAASSTQISLSWTASTDNSGVAPTYEILWCSGATCTPRGTPIAVANTSYTHATRSASTTYRYKIRARDSSGNLSAYTAIASATTQAAPDPTAPSVPTGFRASAASSTQINLSWIASTDNSGVSPTYEILWCSGAGCTPAGTPITVTGTRYNQADRSPSTTYRYKIRAKDGSGNLSAYTAIASATTQASLAAPTGLSISAASDKEIDLTWNAVSGATNYILERCSGAGCSNFSQIGAASANRYFYDAGLTASTSYSYRVKASNGSAQSAASDVQGKSTLAAANCD